MPHFKQVSLDDEFGPGTLRRAHSEELMSEVGLSRDDVTQSRKSSRKVDKHVALTSGNDDDQSMHSLRVSDQVQIF